MTISELKQLFIDKYGDGDIAGFFSPGRVNLIGEHTDYNGGFVFPCAISFGTHCLIRKTNSGLFRFSSANKPDALSLSKEQLTTPLPDSNWVNYPLGTIAQFILQGRDIGTGLDLLFYGNVPNGAGLSSSAALEVVTALAINKIFNFDIQRVTLTKMCQKAEHDFTGVQCGIMDQFASAMGKKDHAIFLNCDTLEYDLIPIVLSGYKIVIANTNSPHRLDSSQYNQRVAECKTAVEMLKPHIKIKQLGDLSWDEFLTFQEKISNKVIRKRAYHVVSEIKRTTDAVNALREGDLIKFGALINASHDSLKNNYEVTGEQLDTMVDEGRKIKGVIGTRMTGGGFGGCTIAIVKDEAINNYIKNVGAGYTLKTGITPEFYIAEISDGGRSTF